MRYRLLIVLLLAQTGCSLIPEIAHQPVVHNPFPQLTKVAIAPFFNLSTEARVDGRQFALAYFNELQLVPGFEVVPVGVVEKTIDKYQLRLGSPEEARKLAQILGVDAVVIGAVTDFSPYYPPRCGMQVEWYAANPCFHPIPPGYGLPWGTREEEYIPAPLVMQSEMALARAQLKTQTPGYQPPAIAPPPARLAPPGNQPPRQLPPGEMPPDDVPPDEMPRSEMPGGEGEQMSYLQGDCKGAGKCRPTLAKRKPRIISPADPAARLAASQQPVLHGEIATTGTEIPLNWPDARGFVPAPPCADPAVCQPTVEPVLRHTKTYNGQDAQFTEALASYVFFQDDARCGGWQSYLQRSDDFIRFCCHIHIFEMLTARGGADETRVVWKWSADR